METKTNIKIFHAGIKETATPAKLSELRPASPHIMLAVSLS